MDKLSKTSVPYVSILAGLYASDRDEWFHLQGHLLRKLEYFLVVKGAKLAPTRHRAGSGYPIVRDFSWLSPKMLEHILDIDDAEHALSSIN